MQKRRGAALKRTAKRSKADLSVRAWAKKKMKTNPGFSAGYQEMELYMQLVELRKKQHLSQRQLAKKADMPQSAIARIESGSHNPTVETFVKIADALGKQISLK